MWKNSVRGMSCQEIYDETKFQLGVKKFQVQAVIKTLYPITKYFLKHENIIK